MTPENLQLRMFVLLLGGLGGSFEFRRDALEDDEFFKDIVIYQTQDDVKGTIGYTVKRHKVVEGDFVEKDRDTEEVLENTVQQDANDGDSVPGE